MSNVEQFVGEAPMADGDLERLIDLFETRGPDEVSPFMIEQALRLAAVASHILPGAADIADTVGDAEAKFEGQVLAQIMMEQFGATDADANSAVELAEDTKFLAIQFAHQMGPDWAQAFYHFAVLVTRLA